MRKVKSTMQTKGGLRKKAEQYFNFTSCGNLLT